MTSKNFNEQFMRVEAEYYAVLSGFEEVFKKYHEAILLQPITKENEDNLNLINEGLKTLHQSFDNITEAFKVMCETKGVILR